MKEVIAGPGPVINVVDSPIPEAGPDQIVIKVVVTGFNPKDWKMTDLWQMSTNPGDDIAGIVYQTGRNVLDFKPGDRVAGLHKAGAPHGSFAEYAVAEANTAFILPPETSFEEAATIPLNVHTAAAGLYLTLGLPPPWCPANQATPLVIWGAASAVSANAIQLASRSNIHPLICIAGKSQAFVESLIDRSKGDTIIDYRADEEAIKDGIKKAAGKNELLYAFEGASTDRSAHLMAELLAPGGKVALVLFEKDYGDPPRHVTFEKIDVRTVHGCADDFGFVLSRFIGRGLQKGWFKPHPHEVVPGGLRGTLIAFENLKTGKANAVKYVARIGETEGLDTT